MELPLGQEHWIKFCIWLVKVIALYNHYSQFYYPLLNRYNSSILPLLWHFFLIPNNYLEQSPS
jgi:hypothetical protein